MFQVSMNSPYIKRLFLFIENYKKSNETKRKIIIISIKSRLPALTRSPFTMYINGPLDNDYYYHTHTGKKIYDIPQQKVALETNPPDPIRKQDP